MRWVKVTLPIVDKFSHPPISITFSSSRLISRWAVCFSFLFHSKNLKWDLGRVRVGYGMGVHWTFDCILCLVFSLKELYFSCEVLCCNGKTRKYPCYIYSSHSYNYNLTSGPRALAKLDVVIVTLEAVFCVGNLGLGWQCSLNILRQIEWSFLLALFRIIR